MEFHLDGVLFKNVFGTPEMREVFCEDHYIETFLEVEAALARAEATAGLIPANAAEEITKRASLEYVDKDRIEELVSETGHTAMSIIGAWKESFGDAGEYIHWGATTQDILDTTVVLQLREALGIVVRDLESIDDGLAALAETHRDTPMIGRTHYVHAIPMTFGLKVAVWVDELARSLERLEEVKQRLLVGQFFGATGTLASIGETGIEVQRHLQDELDMPIPAVVWQPARDRFAEVLNALAIVASTLSKIATQVLFMHRPEVGEVEEGITEGKVGSSTMPHKKNPRKSEGTVMLARLIRANAHAMTETMETVDERSATTWYAEFSLIPETFLFTSRLLSNVVEVIETIEVYPDRMAENIDIYGGLVASERVMMALADRVGRQTAHEIVYRDAMRAVDEGKDFTEVLLQDSRVTDELDVETIETLSDPREYVGTSGHFVDQVLERRE